MRLPDGVELPSAADRELVALLMQAGASLDRMCVTRLYRGVCAHCQSGNPCPPETVAFRFMRGLADTIRASSEVMDLLVLLSTPGGVADLDIVTTPPGDLPPSITARPDQT